MDFYPICSPPALLRVEHEDVVLCLALGKRKPFLSHGCHPFADVSAAEIWCCSVDQALWAGGDSVTQCWQERGSCGDNISFPAPSQMVQQKSAGRKAAGCSNQRS